MQSKIKAIDEIVREMESVDIIFNRVISNTMTFEDYKNCENCISIIGGNPDIVLKKRGSKLIEDHNTEFDIEKDSLIITINSFYSYYNTEIDVDLGAMTKDFDDNYGYWKNYMPWFHNYYK